jgi:hypothetical protein
MPSPTDIVIDFPILDDSFLWLAIGLLFAVQVGRIALRLLERIIP